MIVDLPDDAHDILVSDPKIADAVIRTSRRIYLFGKTVGQTNIFVFDANNQKMVNIDIEVERDVEGLEAKLRRFIPESNIKVEIISDNIVLSGSVRTALDLSQANELVKVFLKGGEATSKTETATSSGGQGSVALHSEARQVSQIVNLLKVDGEDQVTLKVTIAEVRREILKQLGFDNLISNSSGVSVAQLGSSSTDSSSATSGGGLSALFKGALGKYSFSTTINALEQAKVVKTLAEPNLTAISGKAATFNSGGQALYPSTDSNGHTSYTTYDYGINLSFTPTVLSAGRISLDISTSVSEPTTSVSGSTPTFEKRSAVTSVEVPSGGSIALAGLLRNNVSQSTNGTPGLSHVPLLGALFRQKTNEIVETELVIIATPYLVRPVSRTQLSRPDDNFSPDNDVGSFFLGRINKIYGSRGSNVSASEYEGSVGFIYK